MDNIVGLDVVLADGSYVYASGTSNPDLYFVSATHRTPLEFGRTLT